ncbi:hypothetical protein GQ54DRAFT_314287 [Martensiomyces pterosporus]|nr:hypothetical protein GQ54DRAFT_314287 [Martensiomyces pterosporus]
MDPSVLRTTGTIVPPHTHLPPLSLLQWAFNIHTVPKHNEFGQLTGGLRSTTGVKAVNPTLMDEHREASTVPGALNRIADASWVSVMDLPGAFWHHRITPGVGQRLAFHTGSYSLL